MVRPVQTVAAASGWKQSLRAESSKPGSAAGRPAGPAAPLWHTQLLEMPAKDKRNII